MKKLQKIWRLMTSYIPAKQYWTWGMTYGECACGNGVEDRQKYCDECGLKLNWIDKREETRT